MSLFLRGNIPVAARSLTDIELNSEIAHIVGYDPADALASKTKAAARRSWPRWSSMGY